MSCSFLIFPWRLPIVHIHVGRLYCLILAFPANIFFSNHKQDFHNRCFPLVNSADHKHRGGGSRISGKGVHMYKGVGISLC